MAREAQGGGEPFSYQQSIELALADFDKYSTPEFFEQGDLTTVFNNIEAAMVLGIRQGQITPADSYKFLLEITQRGIHTLEWAQQEELAIQWRARQESYQTALEMLEASNPAQPKPTETGSAGMSARKK